MCVCVLGFIYIFIYFSLRSWFVYFQRQSSPQLPEICCIIPGREIPKWFEKVNICGTSVETDGPGSGNTYNVKKVKIQLPGSGCDEWRGIVLCVVFLPIKLHRRYKPLDYRDQRNRKIRVRYEFGLSYQYRCYSFPEYTSEYGDVESHHLWLHSLTKDDICLPETPGRSIDNNGFRQVWLEIQTQGLEVEKIGFRVVEKQDIEDPTCDVKWSMVTLSSVGDESRV